MGGVDPDILGCFLLLVRFYVTARTSIVQWTLSEIIDSDKNEVELTKATLGGI